MQLEALERRLKLSITYDSSTHVYTVSGSTAANTMYAAWRIDSDPNNLIDFTLRLNDGLGNSQDINFGPTGPYQQRVSIYGGNGNDTIASAANVIGFSNTSGAVLGVTMNGGAAADTLYGSDSIDRVYGGSSNDSVIGNAGNDIIYGEDGDDTLDGNGGADSLYGDGGDDVLVGQADSYAVDVMTGGTGADDFYVNGYLSGGIVYYNDNIVDYLLSDVDQIFYTP